MTQVFSFYMLFLQIFFYKLFLVFTCFFLQFLQTQVFSFYTLEVALLAVAIRIVSYTALTVL